jgi:hypothetical protein
MKHNAVAFFLSLLLGGGFLAGQVVPDPVARAVPDNRLSIFVDWQDAEYDYIDFFKTEIPWVTYALDRAVCDVFILITTQETGSGGTEYTLTIFGRQKYEGMNDTLVFILGKDQSEDDERSAVVQKLKLGLVRYASRTDAADHISISQLTASPSPAPVVDKWDHWVFSISANGYLNGVQVSHYNNFYGDLSANRITEGWKLGLYAGGSYNYNIFKLDSVTTYIDSSRSYYAEASLTRSLTRHWSVRALADCESSSYSNLGLHLVAGPSAEYSVFPYSEATRRELKVICSTRYVYNQYLEETIYDKWGESLYRQALSLSIDTKQPWGSIYTVIGGSVYLHDLHKNSISITSTLSLQIIRGLSFNLTGYVYLLHDQLALPKRGMTPEEILLQIKELSSQYRYYASVGLSYSFGSLFSSVVNTRFE